MADPQQRHGGPSVIGLTGGIAVGKTSVSQVLVAKGAYLIDADSVGHRVIAPGGPGYEKVIAAFGKDIVAADGTIDRRKLGAIVFADPSGLDTLNAISHPIMAELMAEEIRTVRAADPLPPVILLDAALLFEAHWDGLCDSVWVVTAARETAIARLMARNNLPRDQAEARLDAQMDPAQKAARAAHVIANEGSLDELSAHIDRLWSEVVQ